MLFFMEQMLKNICKQYYYNNENFGSKTINVSEGRVFK